MITPTCWASRQPSAGWDSLAELGTFLRQSLKLFTEGWSRHPQCVSWVAASVNVPPLFVRSYGENAALWQHSRRLLCLFCSWVERPSICELGGRKHFALLSRWLKIVCLSEGSVQSLISGNALLTFDGGMKVRHQMDNVFVFIRNICDIARKTVWMISSKILVI